MDNQQNYRPVKPERLKDIDIEAVLDLLNKGELSLPCQLAEVDEPDKNEPETITLE